MLNWRLLSGPSLVKTTFNREGHFEKPTRTIHNDVVFLSSMERVDTNHLNILV